MEKRKSWYFVYTNEKGKKEFGAYGDSKQYTQEEALNKMIELYPDSRIAIKGDLEKYGNPF